MRKNLCNRRHLVRAIVWAVMKNRRNYYRILQVQPDAAPEIIHASYRAMMRELKLHPDLGGSASEASLLNEAYETLGNAQRRAAYDEKLFLQFTKRTLSQTQHPISPVLCPICRRPLSQSQNTKGICANCRTPLQSERVQKSEKSDKRSIERSKSSEPILFYSKWPGTPGKGKTIDFSPKGMRFICNEKLKPQTILKISSKLFEASGVVTNLSEEISNGRLYYVVGIYFQAVHFAESRGTFLSTSG